MIEDLRNTDSSPEDDSLQDEQYYDPDYMDDDYEDKSGRLLFGMTAFQRFIIALMLLLMTCLLGGFCLILTERVVLPFF